LAPGASVLRGAGSRLGEVLDLILGLTAGGREVAAKTSPIGMINQGLVARFQFSA
jgi:hypothetical protein